MVLGDAKSEYTRRSGGFLGRDCGSWIKILAFYFIYYSLLAGLTYVSLTYLSGKQPENAPKIRTRLDMPGAISHPFWGIEMDHDGANNEVKLSTKDSAFAAVYNEAKASDTDRFVARMNSFVSTCDADNLDGTDEATIKAAVQAKAPIIGLQLNKVIGWKPYNSHKGRDLVGNDEFVKDAVYFNCFETEEKTKVPKANSKFTFEQVSKLNHLPQSSFPYGGKSEADTYVKPFVLMKINSADGFDDGALHKFRCEVLCDNIDVPMAGDISDEEKGWSTALSGINIGFSDFGIQYED